MTVDPSVKNIIFDLGGVIIDIDYHLTIKAFEQLGLPEFKKHYTQAAQKEIFDLMDKGHISDDDFRKGIQELFPQPVSFEQIDAAWNAMLLEVPSERLDLLAKLQKKYRLFLLSNTNSIHTIEIEKYYLNKFGFRDLSQYFEKLYLSFEIGMRKPDVEIFQYVLDENRLKASETLFIDDSIQHIEGAARLGIQTHFLQAPQTILDLNFNV